MSLPPRWVECPVLIRALCVCMYVCARVCLFVCLFVCNMYLCVYVFVCMRVCELQIAECIHVCGFKGTNQLFPYCVRGVQYWFYFPPFNDFYFK